MTGEAEGSDCENRICDSTQRGAVNNYYKRTGLRHCASPRHNAVLCCVTIDDSKCPRVVYSGWMWVSFLVCTRVSQRGTREQWSRDEEATMSQWMRSGNNAPVADSARRVQTVYCTI